MGLTALNRFQNPILKFKNYLIITEINGDKRCYCNRVLEKDGGFEFFGIKRKKMKQRNGEGIFGEHGNCNYATL